MPISNCIKSLLTTPSSIIAGSDSLPAPHGKVSLCDSQFLSLDDAIKYVSKADIKDSFKQRLFHYDINNRYQQKEISSSTVNLLTTAVNRLREGSERNAPLPRLILNNYQSAREYAQHLSENAYTFNLAINLLLTHHIGEAFEDDTSYFLLKHSFLEIADKSEMDNRKIPGIYEKLHHMQDTLAQHHIRENIPLFKAHIDNVMHSIKNRHQNTENLNNIITSYFSVPISSQIVTKLEETLRQRDELPAPDYLLDRARRMVHSEGYTLEAACHKLKILNDADIAKLKSDKARVAEGTDNPLPPPEYSLDEVLSAIQHKMQGTENFRTIVDTFFPQTNMSPDVVRQLKEAIRGRNSLSLHS